ncbi:helix-turn-helix transcriptional regulator [uncultured Acetobacteroides sp.]|uniref:helix-turn-helix domain-containing protein n=1 Tax=uncultured Acetobacteroides sp. TaxID=1760811 RepID=UPI0029F4B88F|nr:helix-turn-helix transcriptional regulator [uncultured Acetobacteroides sp.]
MLRINLSRVFRALGVHRPTRFLVEKGYTYSTAQRLVVMNHSRFRLEDLEQLCLKLGCTPNDILEWVPYQDQVELDTPLQQLRIKYEPYFDHLLNQLDYSDQQELQRLMEERIALKKGTAKVAPSVSSGEHLVD